MALILSVSLALTDSEIQLCRDFAALDHDDINQDVFTNFRILQIVTHSHRNETFIGFELADSVRTVFVVFNWYVQPEIVGEVTPWDSCASDELEQFVIDTVNRARA